MTKAHIVEAINSSLTIKRWQSWINNQAAMGLVLISRDCFSWNSQRACPDEAPLPKVDHWTVATRQTTFTDRKNLNLGIKTCDCCLGCLDRKTGGWSVCFSPTRPWWLGSNQGLHSDLPLECKQTHVHRCADRLQCRLRDRWRARAS